MLIPHLKTMLEQERQRPIALADCCAFYGVCFFAQLVLWAQLGESASGLLLVLTTVVATLGVFKANNNSQAGVLLKRTLPAALERNWNSFAPLLLSLLWLGMALLPQTGAVDTAFVFMLLSVLMLLAVTPFGALQAILFSLPVLVAANHYALTGPWDSALHIVLLLNISFVVFWYGVLRDQKLLLSSGHKVPELDLAQDDRVASLTERERDLEQTIQDRTKDLRDANTQLSQQIALRKKISDALVKSQTRLTQAIDASRLGLIDWDITNGQFYQSAFHSLFGSKEQDSQELIQTLKKAIHPADYHKVRDTLNACLAGERLEYQLQYRVEDGAQWLWIEECGKVVDHDAAGHAARILGTRRNIHTEMLRDEQVRLAKSVFDHTSEGVFVLDHEACFLSVNPAYTKITGHSSDNLVGQSIEACSETPRKTEVFERVLSEVRSKGQWQGELLEKRRQGDYYPQWTQINAIRDEQGQLKYYAGLVSDLSDRKAVDEKLAYLLNYDDLTKLANRVQFRDQLHRALVRYKDEGTAFALVTMDIDRFKQFNDSFGHHPSDSLLVAVAERLSLSVQKVDILARVGGNEFACLVACSETFSVDQFAQRLFNAVTHKPYEIAGHEVVLSCSVGIALVPEHTHELESLMQFGALAVQKAKFQGGNQVQTFDESLKSFSKKRLEIEQELRKALTQGELEVYYQPKLDLKQSRITSFEALIRWMHPTRGLVSPDEFVNIAEENGLISDLGQFVLETACRQTQLWSEQGLGQLHVSVNLSPRQLKDPALRSVISETLDVTEISPHCVELELTESAIMEDAQSAISLLNDLREIGIKVSVDDFGTGYSSLSYLKELPVDTLKIDRAFIENIEHSKDQQAIAKAIIVLGSTLNLQVVAEGVESQEQLSLLEAYGCDLIQGYFVSKPLAVDAMESLLKQQCVASTKHSA